MKLTLREGAPAPVMAEMLAARIALGRQAVAAAPANRTARRMLCDSLLEADRPDLAIELLQQGGACRDPQELTTLAKIQFVNRDFAAVIETLEQANEPEHLGREGLLLRFEALAKQRKDGEARALLATVQQLEPDNVTALRLSLCEALEHGDHDAALATCERALSVAVTNTTALHYRMVALALSHQSVQAAIEMAMERFVAVAQLDVPTEFADGAGFHRQLALEIRADPTLRADPQGVATRQGWQTLSRSSATSPAMASLLTMIEAAVQRYTQELGDADAHPFVRYRPNRGTLQFWSVLYSDAGYQRPHFHPSGWLSGVYHVSGEGVSGNSAADCDAASGGALVLGDCMHLRRAKITPPWGLRTIPSRAGQLVLFPSFVPHSTRAPHAGIERLSVAFDVKRDA